MVVVRLTNRLTFCDWNREMMGPIADQHGLEQGGCNSSDCYKVYNNELLDTVQNSKQGVDLGNDLVISGVGQADDVALLSNNIFKLFNLLHLALNYCHRYHVELCADKTRLLLMTSKTDQKFIPYNPLIIKKQKITFSEQAEHVGIRSSSGNLPNILNRIVAHKKAMGALCFSGSARSHRGNPAASVRIENMYGAPVLFSGLASLVLSKPEINMLDKHYTNTLRNLLKAHPGTPQSFVLFMCGSLPGSALLHLRQFSLFSMITRLPQDPLNARARQVLILNKPSSKSWFNGLREICLQYRMPHPLTFLENPISKEAFKKLTKSRVIDYWENKLRQEVAFLPSLLYFDPHFHSLKDPHPIFWTAGPNPYEVAKAVVQCKMISGRYRTAMLTKHWSNNRNGWCLSPTCCEVEETLGHLLLWCPMYDGVRATIIRLWQSTPDPLISQLITSILNGPPDTLLKFILDASTNPTAISLHQIFGPQPLSIIFHLTRSWCFSIHKERTRFLRSL